MEILPAVTAAAAAAAAAAASAAALAAAAAATAPGGVAVVATGLSWLWQLKPGCGSGLDAPAASRLNGPRYREPSCPEAISLFKNGWC